MTQPPTDTSTAEVIADLARRVESTKDITPDLDLSIASSIFARTVRNDEEIEVHDLEKHLYAPRRNRGTVTLHDPGDFISYVQRLADEHTTVWGDEFSGRFTAVFNDHADPETAGWRDHTATLALQPDPEWQDWLAKDGKWFSQVDFAEFLEDHAAAIVDPNPADFLEVAMNFKAHKKAEFSGGVDLNTGDVQFTYNEETTAKTTKAGQIDVPRQFTIALAPFLGIPSKTIPSRLRWSVDHGQLTIGYRLHRPDLMARDAFADIRQTIAEGLNPGPDDQRVPVLLGNPPHPVAAHR